MRINSSALFLLTATVLLLAPETASADLTTYAVTTLNGAGTGSITIDQSTIGPLTSASLLAFSFTESLQTFVSFPPYNRLGTESSTFSFGQGDVGYFSGTLAGTPDSPILSFDLAAGSISGTNPDLGNGSLFLFYTEGGSSFAYGVIDPSTYGEGSRTGGALTLTQSSVATPEPSLSVLLGIGLLFLGTWRNRRKNNTGTASKL